VVVVVVVFVVMLSLERLSLYECSVPTGMDAVDMGDDDDFEDPVGADDDEGDDGDDPMQAESDDSQPAADVAAAAAAVPQQQQPAAAAATPPPPKNENKRDDELCKICRWSRPGDRKSWNVIGANEKAPNFLDGNAKSWWRRCCAKHRNILEENTKLCEDFKNPDSTPYPVETGYVVPPADPERKRDHFCKKYTRPDEKYCKTCKDRIEKAAKKAEKDAKDKEKSQKKMNTKVKKDASRAAKLVKEARRAAAGEKKKQNEEDRKAEREAQKAMRDAMGEYGKPFGPPPKLNQDDSKNSDKKAEYDAALRKWTDSLTERFGSLDDQAAYKTADPSVPEVDNAERPVRADQDERSPEARDATAWYTTSRVTEVENLDDGGCCAAKK
jgi:hypothetical protein